jgi:hypothetical protein
LGALYVALVIKDTRGPRSDHPTAELTNSRSILSIHNVIDVLRTCFKQRETYIRSVILLLIMGMLLNLSTISALTKQFNSIVFYDSKMDFYLHRKMQVIGLLLDNSLHKHWLISIHWG